MRKIKCFIVVIVIICLVILAIVNKEKLIKNNVKEEIKFSDNVVKSDFDKVRVDIKGAVNNPGVYEVEDDAIVYDLIELAGGLKENADTSIINLARKLKNEDLIIIYTKEEIENSNIVDTVVKEVDKECICPNIKNDGCINSEINDTISNFDNDSDKDELIDINNASKEELMELSGIGESKADSIIEYRKKNKFNKIDDILNVAGIGNALYEKIKNYIKV